MTTFDYNELLYNKMKKEFDSFISELKTKPPEQIIEGSYEKVIKEDLLAIFEYTEFSQTEAKSLYRLKAPLDDIYQEWCGNDMSYCDMLRETIDDRIKSAVKEMKAKQKDKDIR